MKRIAALICFAVALTASATAQTKISALPSGTPVATDVVPFVSDPAGTAVTKKVTVSTLLGIQHNHSGADITTGTVGAARLPATTVNAVSNDTNVQGSISAQTLTLSWSGTLAKTRQHAATVYTDQANTFGNFVQTFQAGANHLLVDPTDTTKKFQFDVSNMGAGVTRTVNVPNANSTTAQALTCTNQFVSAMSAQGIFTCATVPNAALTNSSVTLNAGSSFGLTVPGGMTLGSTYTIGATTDNLRFNGLGLGVAAPTTAGQIAATGGANNLTLFTLKRNTDTSPTGNFEDFKSAAAASLWTVDITGSLAAGTVPVARVSGLATSATTDATNAANISSGTLAVARGGTNLTSSADDNVMVGNGTTWQSKSVPTCTDTGGNHLNYDTSTNAFSCGTSSSSGGGSTSTNGQSLLGADFDITGSSFVDTGLSVSLPSSGTYLVIATVVSNYNSSSSAPEHSYKFYNSTDAADVANSLVRSYDPTSNVYFVRALTFQNIITVAAGKTIKLYASRSTPTYTLSRILANSADGYTRMQYIKLN